MNDQEAARVAELAALWQDYRNCSHIANQADGAMLRAAKVERDARTAYNAATRAHRAALAAAEQARAKALAAERAFDRDQS